jgi:hypothetical protein
MIPIRRLDSLLAEGVIPTADFIKVDVEGFEKDVLLGARELLRAGVLGLEIETNFGVSPTYPKSHFGQNLRWKTILWSLTLHSIGFRARASNARLSVRG